jgi:hypothetical protein
MPRTSRYVAANAGGAVKRASIRSSATKRTRAQKFDNAKPVILERDMYGAGQHRWHAGMLEFSRALGFQLRVCRPYRAKTKANVSYCLLS